MYRILRFSRVRSTIVEETKDGLLKSECYLRDNINEIKAILYTEPPELKIKEIQIKKKIDYKWQSISSEHFKKIIGSRIGSGIFKIIKSEVEDAQFRFMLEECCRAVILSFTKQDLLNSPRPEDDEEAIKYYAEMVKQNVRLYGRCAAFSPGSRIVEGIKNDQVYEK